MNKEANNTSTLISLILHVGIIVLLYFFSKPISVLIPSRSDGIEVGLVSMPHKVVSTTNLKFTKPTPIKPLLAPAEVNLKASKPFKAATSGANTAATQSPAPVTPDSQTPITSAKPKTTKNQKALLNDLVSDLMSDNATTLRKGKATGGTATGTSNSDNLIGNYADLVINAVRPFVTVPATIDPSSQAVVKVTLNPDLSVRQVTLLQSSGNTNYDDNIQLAIKRVKIFPPLPDGAHFVDYRVLRLTFRPQ